MRLSTSGASGQAQISEERTTTAFKKLAPSSLGLVALLVLLLLPRAGNAEPPVRCEELSFEVALTPDSPADQTIAASLCARGTIQKKTIQILLHGGTFDHNYWDFPLEPETYSYIHHITRAGYAVLNLDRVGFGLSSHPDGLNTDLHKEAFTVHQIVQALRGGNIVVPGFGRVRGRRIQLVGSSMGAFISVIEASNYDDVDGVVLTSYSHRLPPGAGVAFDLSIPAQEDPKFADFPYPNYLSSEEGYRDLLFYHLPNIDPEVSELDTALRQPVPAGTLFDIPGSVLEPPNIRAPTLIVNGDYDALACDVPCTETNWLEDETSLYPPEACAELVIIPDSGHALTLHRNAKDFFGVVREWSDRRVGASTKSPPPEPCRP